MITNFSLFSFFHYHVSIKHDFKICCDFQSIIFKFYIEELMLLKDFSGINLIGIHQYDCICS